MTILVHSEKNNADERISSRFPIMMYFTTLAICTTLCKGWLEHTWRQTLSGTMAETAYKRPQAQVYLEDIIMPRMFSCVRGVSLRMRALAARAPRFPWSSQRHQPPLLVRSYPAPVDGDGDGDDSDSALLLEGDRRRTQDLCLFGTRTWPTRHPLVLAIAVTALVILYQRSLFSALGLSITLVVMVVGSFLFGCPKPLMCCRYEVRDRSVDPPAPCCDCQCLSYDWYVCVASVLMMRGSSDALAPT